ncbi:MAG: hypothetical protein DME80_12215 [Verrucomicrobia bacterium]|nr:MAG: hypothetical protein DMC60_11600 [Verrucomicrobiota bacterium]PYJ42146.1 MAG: hypothetical protein DME80_12215 [Verrucomicrobiota bacterium]
MWKRADPNAQAAAAACASSWSTVRTAVKASQDNTRGLAADLIGVIDAPQKSGYRRGKSGLTIWAESIGT